MNEYLQENGERWTNPRSLMFKLAGTRDGLQEHTTSLCVIIVDTVYAYMSQVN